MSESSDCNTDQPSPEIKTAENPVAQPTINTQRLVLRPFDEADCDTVQELLQCKEIAANTRTIEHPYPDGAARIWIGTHLPKWNRGEAAIFAITLPDNPQAAIGAIGLEINAPDENAELGYWIGQPFWGRGICSEAAQAIVDFGFQHFGLKKIHAHHVASNPASGRVMEKIGMAKEGYLKSHIKKWGVFQDVVFYDIVATDD